MLCLCSTLDETVSKCILFLFYFFFFKFVFQLFIQKQCVKVTFLKFQVLREKTNVIASFPEHLLYSNFEMFRPTQKACTKAINFFVILGPPRRKNDIASFVEHSAYSNFKMYSVSWFYFSKFWFPTIHPKFFCKSHFFLKFRCFTKRAVPLSWSTLYTAVSKCIVCWF